MDNKSKRGRRTALYYRIVPKVVRDLIVLIVTRTFHRKVHRGLPVERVFLKERNLHNCTFVESRTEMLRALPAGGTVAIIGLLSEEYVSEVIRSSYPRKLFLMMTGEHRETASKVSLERMLQKFRSECQSVIVSNYSLHDIEQFEDDYFDWMYFDTESPYLMMKKELALFGKKTKKHGFICGNKYTIGIWKKWIKYDTIESVNEFCVKNDYEVKYFAQAADMLYSFALRKINVVE